MNPAYLLDTNVISEPLRPEPQPLVLQHFEAFQDQLAIPALVWHELWFGCLRLPASKRRNAIEEYLLQVVSPAMPILPYDAQAAVWHAAERARLARLGKTPSFVDGQIAASARVRDLTLVTFNLEDFKEFQDIRVVDWRS
jgi:tRNA(fMet)-specific endonuclease VapC